MNAEKPKSTLEFPDNPKQVEIIFEQESQALNIAQHAFQLLELLAVERNVVGGKVSLKIKLKTNFDFSTKAKEFLQALANEGCEILFT